MPEATLDYTHYHTPMTVEDTKLARHVCGAWYYWARYRPQSTCRCLCCDGKRLVFEDGTPRPEDQYQWEQYKNQANSGDEVLGSNPTST